MLNKRFIKRKIYESFKSCVVFAKWVAIALIMGVIGGVVGSAFHMAVNFATSFRTENDWTLFLMPVGGLLIVFLYRICKIDEDTGTNLIISSIRTNIKVPLVMAPLIFVSTVITHLVGGSAGREGAALQLGGSIGSAIGEKFHLDEKDMSLAIMCGMSSVFAALFGTPLTAAFFAMEVISVGVIYYVGLIPCIVSALTAFEISLLFKLEPTAYKIAEEIPKVTVVSVIQTGVLAMLCAVVSMAFCIVMKRSHELFKIHIKNTYLRILAGSAILMVITLIIGERTYNGAGGDIIKAAIEDGQADYSAFLLKIIFTAVTIGSGFKGGEIVPTFFIGATFGCAFGSLLGINPSFAAAVGLVATFCGVVNCPIASIFLSYELFGGGGIILFAISCGVSYMLSGYYGLYSSQKIMYSKLKPEYINVNAK
ncbi:MAG: chloride channel protein [Hominimerdicola sp.]